MLMLTIQHNVYLTREQRYDLHNKIDVETVGVSVPVWQFENKTSEPAKEILCKYLLRNTGEDLPIKILKDGYSIHIPSTIPRKQREIPTEEWIAMSQEQREAYYTSKFAESASLSLLDVKDGGSETLMYRESNTVKNDDRFMKIIHYINILDINYLKEEK